MVETVERFSGVKSWCVCVRSVVCCNQGWHAQVLRNRKTYTRCYCFQQLQGKHPVMPYWLDS